MGCVRQMYRNDSVVFDRVAITIKVCGTDVSQALTLMNREYPGQHLSSRSIGQVLGSHSLRLISPCVGSSISQRTMS